MLVLGYQEKMQKHKQFQRTTWGTEMNPTNYVYMFEEEEKDIHRIDNRDPYKEEIKIPPPYPYKRKNINYFCHSKDPYFLSSETPSSTLSSFPCFYSSVFCLRVT
jgi:hypothetical protein